MDMDKLTEEMQRVQMEYATNPTPENLEKMLGEMMRLQEEMMQISMQGIAKMQTEEGINNAFFCKGNGGSQGCYGIGRNGWTNDGRFVR